MDPNANLKEQLEIARRLAEREEDELLAETGPERLAELVLALDEWLRAGGFLPAAWSRDP